MRKQRVRITDVAILAGVSPATVSVVINDRVGDSVRVSPETAERVWQAVRQLGYVASPVARRLAGGSTQIIGLFTYESIFPIKHHNFYYPFLVGIELEVEQQGYDLLLFTSYGPSMGPRSVFKDGINRLKVAEGAIFLGLQEDKSELLALYEEGYSFVFIGRRELEQGEISYVAADYAAATQQIVSYIIGFGHQKIMYMRSGLEREAHMDRHQGYLSGLQGNGLPYIEELDFILDPATINQQDLSGWLQQGVTAFVVETNTQAEFLLHIANMLGKSPPDDFSVAVLGDPLVPSESNIEWTTFQIPRREMGAQAVQLLVQMLSEDVSENRVFRRTLACTFVPGKTVGSKPTSVLWKAA